MSLDDKLKHIKPKNDINDVFHYARENNHNIGKLMSDYLQMYDKNWDSAKIYKKILDNYREGKYLQ